MKRTAFTLIELLIVIAIIGILASISFVAIANYVEVAKEAKTKAIISKVDTLLSDRRVAFQQLLNQPAFERSVEKTRQEMLSRGVQGMRQQAIEALVAKRMERARFPQRFADISGFPVPPNHDPVTESAELLYYQLTAIKIDMTYPVEESAFEGSVADTDNDGLLEIVDGWGQPLRFYRWPTRLIRPGGSGSPPRRDVAQLLIDGLPNAPQNPTSTDEIRFDPGDHVGAIPLEQAGNPWLQSEWTEQRYHTLGTWHTILVVSPGPDGHTGLFEPQDVANFGHLAQPLPSVLTNMPGARDPLTDNITNRQGMY